MAKRRRTDMAKRRHVDALPEPAARKSPKPKKFPVAVLRAIRSKLCEQLGSLCGVVDGARCDRQQANPWARDPMDAAQGICADDVSKSVLGMSQETLVAIVAAIERIDNGTYGVCCRCAGQIAQTRLEASPIVAFCIECQRILEKEAAVAHGKVKPYDDAADTDDDGEEDDEEEDEAEPVGEDRDGDEEEDEDDDPSEL